MNAWSYSRNWLPAMLEFAEYQMEMPLAFGGWAMPLPHASPRVEKSVSVCGTAKLPLPIKPAATTEAYDCLGGPRDAGQSQPAGCSPRLGIDTRLRDLPSKEPPPFGRGSVLEPACTGARRRGAVPIPEDGTASLAPALRKEVHQLSHNAHDKDHDECGPQSAKGRPFRSIQRRVQTSTGSRPSTRWFRTWR